MSDGTHTGKPDHVSLSELITGKGAEVFWLPEARSTEQRDARAALVLALHGFERAFGVEATVRQMALFIATGKVVAEKNAAIERALSARADINYEAAMARRAGNVELALEIEARPTPNYPEKAQDEKVLGYEI